VCVNHYFQGQAAIWTKEKRDPRWQRVRVAKRFSRIAYSIVAGRQLFAHPCCQQESYILDKLVAFHLDHGACAEELRANLVAAAGQLPNGQASREAEPLRRPAQRNPTRRKRGPQGIGEILCEVIAKLVSVPVESSNEPASSASASPAAEAATSN
jgi:hypothetical protein